MSIIRDENQRNGSSKSDTLEIPVYLIIPKSGSFPFVDRIIYLFQAIRLSPDSHMFGMVSQTVMPVLVT